MILNRAPYYYNVVYPNDFITSIDFTVNIGTGSTTTITVEQTRAVSKPNPSAATTNSWLDISPFVRDLFTYTSLTTAGTSSDEVVVSPLRSVLLAQVTAEHIDSIGSNEADTSQKYICLDGYGYYTDGQNFDTTASILLSHTAYKADGRGFFIVPLRGFAGAPDPTVNTVGVTLGFTDNSQNYIKYLVVVLSDYSGTVTVEYNGSTILIELIEECKFPVTEVQFFNRWGVLETIHFYKSTKESININKETFKNAFTNGVSYDVQRHQLKNYNVASNKTLRIETGFLSEDYNATIQELLQSENVWIDGVPVNPNTSSLEFKTRIIDKLISYSIEFEYAFDEINNV